MTDESQDEDPVLLCSNCFRDEGLRIDASNRGIESADPCPNCRSLDGHKLTRKKITGLASRFFDSGTTIRLDYGAAPRVRCNDSGNIDITPSAWLREDIELMRTSVRLGLFRYGPRLWMVGHVSPLEDLQDPAKRAAVIARVLTEYPEKTIVKDTKFYRLRVAPRDPADPKEYDSPPLAMAGGGRLDSAGFAVMYVSQDIDVCIHECRASTEDDIYVGTLRTNRDLRLLDLTHVLEEEGVTEFDSLDMAIHMLFLARSHSYEISRAIAIAAKDAGFDGVIYPSFFSLIRTGGHPFETSYGLSLRKYLPEKEKYAKAYTIENFALFGRPMAEGWVRVDSLNRLVLTQVGYRAHFGPVAY